MLSWFMVGLGYLVLFRAIYGYLGLVYGRFKVCRGLD